MREYVLHLRRHMNAREPVFVGKSIVIPGTDDFAYVGNGNHPDEQAHLQAEEYVRAEEIGAGLYIPQGVEDVCLASSPLVRAEETARHMFVGMARAYAERVLQVSKGDKKNLSEKGLHRKVYVREYEGLNEPRYKNSRGAFDDGNELVAEAYHKGVNPNFSGYRWMVQKGFEGDTRAEHPQSITDRALISLLGETILFYDLTLATSHQPNMEVITAALTGNLGSDANELWENAGGSYAMGGGFELRVYFDKSKVNEARLLRTAGNPMILEKELNVDLAVINKFLRF